MRMKANCILFTVFGQIGQRSRGYPDPSHYAEKNWASEYAEEQLDQGQQGERAQRRQGLP